jgi:cyclopropane fatty-acyl-phospholipid synthase-like methyltransferase
MDRMQWLKEQRREAEERYSTLWAPHYWETFGFYPNASHLQFIQKFKDLLPQNSTILDAACGAGRYMPEFVGKGFTVVGIDQSEGMLARAQEKFPEVTLEKVGLQEMSFREMFEGAICMDAMEHVAPEDWPVILANFQRALKRHGYLYFTVEIQDETEVKAAFEQAQQAGLPVVYGEWVNDEVYHYYPTMEQVRDWVQQAGFTILEEGEGDGYHHFLMRKA